MANRQLGAGIREAFTFDDVLLKPGLSDILPSDADVRTHLTRAIPLGRLADPDDIAGSVLFFASDHASFITGQTLSVSGGLSMT